MSTTWLKIKVWTKVVVGGLVLLYLLIFVLNNSNKDVAFWYWFGHEWNTSLLYFTFFTVVGGVLAGILLGTVRKTLAQVRELRKRTEQERKDRQLKELQSKAAMLQTRPEPLPVADPASDKSPPADAKPRDISA